MEWIIIVMLLVLRASIQAVTMMKTAQRSRPCVTPRMCALLIVQTMANVLGFTTNASVQELVSRKVLALPLLVFVTLIVYHIQHSKDVISIFPKQRIQEHLISPLVCLDLVILMMIALSFLMQRGAITRLWPVLFQLAFTTLIAPLPLLNVPILQPALM